MDKREEKRAIMEHVEEISQENTLVIVEGRKDQQALFKLGIVNTIRLDAPYRLIEKMNGKNVAILSDLDSEGKKIYRRVKDVCSRYGINVNDRFRYFLFKNTQLRQIEGLFSYVERLNKNF